MVADPGTGRFVMPGFMHQDAVEVRRSTRRRRTVSAYRDGDRTIVLLPARLSQAEEKRWVGEMLERLAKQERKRRPTDDALFERAHELSARYLGGQAVPSSVRWVDNQNTRWGSCTPIDATIRLSSRLQGMPPYVVDYVLLHELAHLLEPGHGPRFWTLLAAYPRTERARGYLEGVAGAAGLKLSDENDDVPDVPEVPVAAAPVDGGRAARVPAPGRAPRAASKGQSPSARNSAAEAARGRKSSATAEPQVPAARRAGRRSGTAKDAPARECRTASRRTPND